MFFSSVGCFGSVAVDNFLNVSLDVFEYLINVGDLVFLKFDIISDNL